MVGPTYQTTRKKLVLKKLKSQVVEITGAEAASLRPQAVVSMIATGSPRRRLHTREGIGVYISLHEGTKPLEILIEGREPPGVPDLLSAGEAVAFDRRNAHRDPEGDWQRTLCFSGRK